MNGWLTQNRHYAANLGARHRIALRIARGMRWLWWVSYGWPIFSAAALAFVGLFIAIPASWLLPIAPWSHGADTIAGIARAWPDGQPGAILAGVIAAGLAGGKVWLDYRIKFPWFRLLATALGAGLPVLAVVYTTRLLGTTTITVLAACVAVFGVADAVVGWSSPRWWLRRVYAEWRREVPPHWTDLAARSQRIQSIDNRVERTVTESATNRPILEHPALGPVWQTRYDYDALAVEVPIARPEGRSFEALEAVLDEWAAQYFTVADGPDSIRLIWPDRDASNFASRIWIRIEFKAARAFPRLPRRPRHQSAEPEAGTDLGGQVLTGPWPGTTNEEGVA